MTGCIDYIEVLTSVGMDSYFLPDARVEYVASNIWPDADFAIFI